MHSSYPGRVSLSKKSARPPLDEELAPAAVAALVYDGVHRELLALHLAARLLAHPLALGHVAGRDAQPARCVDAGLLGFLLGFRPAHARPPCQAQPPGTEAQPARTRQVGMLGFLVRGKATCQACSARLLQERASLPACTAGV